VGLGLLEQRFLFLLGLGPERALVGLGLEWLTAGADGRHAATRAARQQQAHDEQPREALAHQLREPSCWPTLRSSSRKPAASGAPPPPRLARVSEPRRR